MGKVNYEWKHTRDPMYRDMARLLSRLSAIWKSASNMERDATRGTRTPWSFGDEEQTVCEPIRYLVQTNNIELTLGYQIPH